MKTNYLDYIMRGGSNPDKEIDAIEMAIAKEALKEYFSNPHYMKKGLKWTYNWTHFRTLYWTQNPEILKLIYKKKWQPHYLEIEVSTCCNLKCTMCVKGNEIVSGNEIKDLKTGNKLFSRKGDFQEVQIPLSREYNGEMIKIKAEGILPFSVTPEHRILVSRRKFQEWPRNERRFVYSKPKFVPANKLTRDHALVLPKQKSMNYRSFSRDEMWLMGLYMAEGCVSRNRVVLYFGKKERKLIDEAKRIITKLGSKCSESETRTCIRLDFVNKKILDNAKEFGTRAFNKKIPRLFFHQEKDLVKNFIEGFIEGDGYVNKNYIQLTTSSKVLALGFQKLLTRLDIFGKVYEDKREGVSFIEGRKVKIHNLYNVRITRPDALKFINLGVKNTKNNYGKDDENFYLPIKKILSEDYEGVVYNIETEDKEYDVNNVVIHNCEHTYWCEKNQNMSFEDFKKILDQFPQLKWLGMTGIGESYLNPEYPKMLEYVKKKGIYVENFDNFCFVDEEKCRQMVELGMDKLYVSLDAATKETYEKIRVGASWDKVIHNIKTLDRIKKELNSYFPELWFHFIISKDNKHEAVEYLEMIDKLGINVKQVQFTILLHAYKEIADKFVEFNDEDKKPVYEKAKQLGIQVSFNVNTADKCRMPGKNKCTAWTQPFIFVDGTMIQCCSMNEQNDRTWQKKTAIGNVLTEGINKIWKDFKHPSDKCERCILFK